MLTRLAALLVAAALLPAGCRSVTSERIAGWKSTDEGREELVAALRDGGVALERRAEAAAALVEVGWVDRVESAVAGMPLEERARLIPAIAPLVARSLEAPDAARRWDAREALFGLRRHATTEEGTRSVDTHLLPALERDLRAGRSDGGRLSVKEMLVAIGALSVPVAARVLADARAPFEVAVEVVDKVGDKAAREAGGNALVDRARGGAPLTPALWQGLGTLGGPRAVAFLQEKIKAGAGEEADEAARTLAKGRRDRALLPFALEVAGSESPRPVVREQMLALVQAIGGDEARKGLVELIAAGRDPAFQFQVFQTAVKGDGKAVLPALEAFPQKASYDPAVVREHLVAPLVGMGWPAREGIFKALQSPSPLARVTAVWTLEKVGFDSDAAPVGKLAGDRGRPKGFPPGLTIGAEAARVASALKKPGA
jgi:hypothetical protein